jgi:hypothetical protein
MSQDVLRPITATTPVDGNAAPAAPKLSDSLSFQRLLESMQKLAHEKQRASDGDGGGAEQLQQALKAADDGFVTAMDLRQKLEAAFRAQRP